MQEARDLIDWIEEKLDHACESTLPIYSGMFKSSWDERFGSEDDIPVHLFERMGPK